MKESRQTAAWLAAWQHRFSSVLRTPLERSRGVLTAAVSQYDVQLAREVVATDVRAGGERLAVYNRQYWFRLFGALQNEFRLTSRLLSYWVFNEYAARFLSAHPPRGVDLAEVADGFETFLGDALPQGGVRAHPKRALLPKSAIVEAAQLDAALRVVHRAPFEALLQLTGLDPSELAMAQLEPSAGLVLFEEHWPLVKLRQQLSAEDGQEFVQLPGAHEAARWWAIFRTETGHGVLPLCPLQARLFQLMSSHPVAHALALLEVTASAQERRTLAVDAQRWLGESVRFGLWASVKRASE